MVDVLNVVCSDYALAHILQIIQRIISIIRTIVPIFLIVGGTIVFVKYVFDPDNKKLLKSFFTAIASTVIIILFPFIINVIMAIISTYGGVGVRENGSNVAFNVSNCWRSAGIEESVMDSANTESTTPISSEYR